MNLIKNFEQLIKGGLILNFKIAAAGENVQLDIIPAGKDSKTGVSLPPRALVGTAAEIDAALDEFLPKYAGSVSRIAEVVANADAELAQAEQAAADLAQRTVEDKAKAKLQKSVAIKAHGPASAKRDPVKGLLNEDDSDDGSISDDEEDENGGITLNRTAEGEHSEASPDGALNSALF